MDDISVDKEF